MYCGHCGTALTDEAKFCHQCGAALVVDPAKIHRCSIVFKEVASKWSLFGKEICRFEAIDDTGSVIAVSDKVTLSGFEINGPNEKNRKHKAAFDGLVKKLLAAGWQMTDKKNKHWYELSLHRR